MFRWIKLNIWLNFIGPPKKVLEPFNFGWVLQKSPYFISSYIQGCYFCMVTSQLQMKEKFAHENMSCIK